MGRQMVRRENEPRFSLRLTFAFFFFHPPIPNELTNLATRMKRRCKTTKDTPNHDTIATSFTSLASKREPEVKFSVVSTLLP